MPTLYHHPMSTASRFVRLILSEYGYQTELAEEQPWEKRRDFLTLNPAGTLPVYVDDSMRALCGATVISEYLDETNGVLKRDRRLLAEDPFQRAEIRRLTEWFLQKMEADVTRPLVRERIFKLQMTPDQGGGAPDSKMLRTSRSNIRQHLKYLALACGLAHLSGRRPPVLCRSCGRRRDLGARLSRRDRLDGGAAVKDWYQRLKSRPSFRPLLAERVRGVTPGFALRRSRFLGSGPRCPAMRSWQEKQDKRRRTLTSFLKDEARDKGFDVCRVTRPDSIPQAPERLADFLGRGYHGTMDWMAETAERRADPRVLWSDVRSVVLFGMNYGPEDDPRSILDRPDRRRHLRLCPQPRLSRCHQGQAEGGRRRALPRGRARTSRSSSIPRR